MVSTTASPEVKAPVWPEPGATQPDSSNSHPVSNLAAVLKERLGITDSQHRDDGAVHLFVEADHHPEQGWNTAPGELKKVDKDSAVHGPSDHENAIAKVAAAVGCEVKILARYAHGVEALFTAKK